MDETLYDYNIVEKRRRRRDRGYADDLQKQVEFALEDDNRELFVKFINRMPTAQLEEKMVTIRYDVFDYDSVRCVAAVLAGETKISNVLTLLSGTYDPHKSTPLHHAASESASRILVLLLHHGFSPNLRCLDPYYPNSLPLTVFLSSFCQRLRRFKASTVTCVVPLIVQLCRTEKHHLEAVRLLALHTRELKREFVNYLKEGSFIEVGALLLVAKSRLLSLSTSKEEEEEGEHDLGFQNISEMHDFLLQAKASSQLSSCRLAAIDDTLLLLKIFDKIGDKLSTLIRLNLDQMSLNASAMVAASLIEDAGFDVPENAVKPHFSTSMLRFQSNVFERAVDDPKNTGGTTEMLPSYLKEAALRGLADKYGNSSPLSNNYISGSVKEINRACSKSPSLPHHLLKQLGTLKRVARRA